MDLCGQVGRCRVVAERKVVQHEGKRYSDRTHVPKQKVPVLAAWPPNSLARSVAVPLRISEIRQHAVRDGRAVSRIALGDELEIAHAGNAGSVSC
jgi:hypothetical protein